MLLEWANIYLCTISLLIFTYIHMELKDRQNFIILVFTILLHNCLELFILIIIIVTHIFDCVVDFLGILDIIPNSILPGLNSPVNECCGIRECIKKLLRGRGTEGVKTGVGGELNELIVEHLKSQSGLMYDNGTLKNDLNSDRVLDFGVDKNGVLLDNVVVKGGTPDKYEIVMANPSSNEIVSFGIEKNKIPSDFTVSNNIASVEGSQLNSLPKTLNSIYNQDSPTSLNILDEGRSVLNTPTNPYVEAEPNEILKSGLDLAGKHGTKTHLQVSNNKSYYNQLFKQYNITLEQFEDFNPKSHKDVIKHVNALTILSPRGFADNDWEEFLLGKLKNKDYNLLVIHDILDKKNSSQNIDLYDKYKYCRYYYGQRCRSDLPQQVIAKLPIEPIEPISAGNKFGNSFNSSSN